MMERLSVMKWIAVMLAAWALSGCATEPDAPDDPVRAKNVAKARTELAAAYYERGQYKVALEELSKAIRADSGYAPAYSVRGLVNMTLREDSDADSDFRRALRLDSGNSETHNNYGWFLCQRGREDDAVKHFLIAARDPLYPTPEKAYLNAGLCSKKASKMTDAEMYLQRALTLQPGMPGALAGLADVAYSNRDYASAKSYFKRYEKTPGVTLTAETLLLAVRIEHKLGNRAEMQGYAARLKRDFPDSRETVILGQIR